MDLLLLKRTSPAAIATLNGDSRQGEPCLSIARGVEAPDLWPDVIESTEDEYCTRSSFSGSDSDSDVEVASSDDESPVAKDIESFRRRCLLRLKGELVVIPESVLLGGGAGCEISHLQPSGVSRCSLTPDIDDLDATH